MELPKNYITVSLLNSFIRNTLVIEDLLQTVVVFGEISGLKIQGGHSYFILKDENAAINCNCFNYLKTNISKDGEGVLIYGKVDYYEKTGKLNLNVSKIIPIGKGLSALELQILKEKLSKEGLFDEKYKKIIPSYMENICVITSKTGAVIKDIITTVRKENKIQNIKIMDTRVQGIDAYKDIIKALKIADNLNFDCIIIARGGGSAEELNVFNNESLAREVFNASTPIISAIGHETDYTILDLVADYRAATPTAAAEYVAFNEKTLKSFFLQNSLYIGNKLSALINKKFKSLTLNVQLSLEIMNGLYKIKKSTLKNRITKVQDEINKSILVRQLKLDSCISLLDAKSPINILKKGYFVVEKINGRNKVFKIGDNIVAKSENIKIYATINNIENKDK